MFLCLKRQGVLLSLYLLLYCAGLKGKVKEQISRLVEEAISVTCSVYGPNKARNSDHEL